ncbi:MAG: PilN domain-containing protein [Pseudobdellovibrionaceae bacterium]|nr:PilN domain-containing protein [Pseudobdellovibrionaceae bacterium]
MIRINLLKAVNPGARQSIDIDNVIGSADVLQGSDVKQIQIEAFKNLVLMAIGVVVLKIYESHHLSELRRTFENLETEYSAKSAKNLAAAQAVEQIEKLKKEQEILQNQIASIENLRKDRNKILKILELIQKQIPSNVWFQSLSFDQNSVFLTGYAVSDSDVTSLLEILSKSVYFKETSLLRSLDEKHQKLGLLKKVEIRCILETKL